MTRISRGNKCAFAVLLAVTTSDENMTKAHKFKKLAASLPRACEAGARF